MFEKHLWKSDTNFKLRFMSSTFFKNVTLPRVFFKHFAGKNQLSGFCIGGTLEENGLKGDFRTRLAF